MSGGFWGCLRALWLSERVWVRLGASVRVSARLYVCGGVVACLGASGRVWARLGGSRHATTADCLAKAQGPLLGFQIRV